MENVASEVKQCLSHTQYGGKPCLVLHGIGSEDNLVFNDSVNFLAKNEYQKAVSLTRA